MTDGKVVDVIYFDEERVLAKHLRKRCAWRESVKLSRAQLVLEAAYERCLSARAVPDGIGWRISACHARDFTLGIFGYCFSVCRS